MSQRRGRGAWQGGWWSGARPVPSRNFNARPPGEVVDLVVVHSISLPPGEFGGEYIEALFTNRLDVTAHPFFATLQGLEVSAHFLIRRDGSLLQFVSCDDRAWHAGASVWRGRSRCNDYSIGIEVEGLEGGVFEPTQYQALARTLRQLAAHYPVTEVVGHEHVAPGRKCDPGPGFDWAQLRKRLRRHSPRLWPCIGEGP